MEDKENRINRKDEKGYTLLYQALKDRNPDLPKILLSHTKIDPNVKTNNGTSIFDEIIKYDYSMTGPQKYDYSNPNLLLPFFYSTQKFQRKIGMPAGFTLQ